MDPDQVFQISVPVHYDILKYEFPMLSTYSPQQRERVFKLRDILHEQLISHITITPPVLTVADVTLDPNTRWEDEDDGTRYHQAKLKQDVDANIGGYKIKYSAGTDIRLVLDGENQGTALFDATLGHLVTPEGHNIRHLPHTQQRTRTRTRARARARRENKRCSRTTRKN